jgi:hypothetical protein
MIAFSTEGIELDAEFARLIPAPSADEYSQLATNLQEFGCLDPLICWGDILLDGHTRFKICCQHEIAFKVKRLRFADRNAAKNWIIHHQLGRRNITPETRKYLLGCLYLEERIEHGGDRTDGASGQNVHLKTAEKIAVEHDVDERTVRRAGQFAKAVDTIAETAGDEVKEAILSREVKSTDADVKALSELPAKKQKAAAEKITSGKVKSVKEALPKKKAEPADEGGFEPHEASKPLGKIDELLTKMMEQYSAAERILGKNDILMRQLHEGLDKAYAALTQLRGRMRRAK